MNKDKVLKILAPLYPKNLPNNPQTTDEIKGINNIFKNIVVFKLTKKTCGGRKLNSSPQLYVT
jgi:hypothetical protein